MPAQNTKKHSPRTQAKQIQSIGTPIRTEYAGPAFHHSPAPSSLPPPPFLMAKSKSQQKENLPSDLGVFSTAAESSPLGFLFSAKEREDSLKRLQKEKPPTLGFHYTPVAEPASIAQQPRSVTYEVEDAGITSSQRDSRPVSAPQESNATNTAKDVKKKSPWAPIEKPPPVDVSDPARDVSEDIPVSSKSRERPRTPMTRQVNDKTPTSSPRPARMAELDGHHLKKASSEGLRKKRTPRKNGEARQSTTPVKVMPKTILKRPVDSGAETTSKATNDTTIAPAVRESAASTFKPLKKEHTTNQQTSKALHSAKEQSDGHDSEVELRKQAAHLMAILNISTPSPQREASPARQHFPTTNNSNNNTNMHDASVVESDLRRLLRLGA